MINKRRTGLEIVGNILDLSQYGAKKTELLYKNNMSYLQLNAYLKTLIEHDILKENVKPRENGKPERKIYINTQKGNDLLDDINKVYRYFE